MESYYEINVALNGIHFFATAPRSCRTKQEFNKVLVALQARFLESEGYSVTATYWESKGFSIDVNK